MHMAALAPTPLLGRVCTREVESSNSFEAAAAWSAQAWLTLVRDLRPSSRMQPSRLDVDDGVCENMPDLLMTCIMEGLKQNNLVV